MLGEHGADIDTGERMAVKSAIESGDYDTWADLTEGRCGNVNEDTFNEITERHNLVEDALESGDYGTWADLMDGRGRVSEVINEDNFDTFVKMHEAMEDGDYDTAQEIREELGLGMHHQDGTGFRKGGNDKHGGMMNGSGARRGFNS